MVEIKLTDDELELAFELHAQMEQGYALHEVRNVNGYGGPQAHRNRCGLLSEMIAAKALGMPVDAVSSANIDGNLDRGVDLVLPTGGTVQVKGSLGKPNPWDSTMSCTLSVSQGRAFQAGRYRLADYIVKVALHDSLQWGVAQGWMTGAEFAQAAKPQTHLPVPCLGVRVSEMRDFVATGRGDGWQT